MPSLWIILINSSLINTLPKGTFLQGRQRSETEETVGIKRIVLSLQLPYLEILEVRISQHRSILLLTAGLILDKSTCSTLIDMEPYSGVLAP